jgi:hypothetical protein
MPNNRSIRIVVPIGLSSGLRGYSADHHWANHQKKGRAVLPLAEHSASALSADGTKERGRIHKADGEQWAVLKVYLDGPAAGEMRRRNVEEGVARSHGAG